MIYWKSLKFWLYCGGFLVPSLFLAAACCGIFIHLDTGAVKGLGIIGSSLLLALLLTWRLARDAVIWDRKHAARKVRVNRQGGNR
jgi:hypothetical protein